MTERLQRLVMHAFRGVPTEMTVDFGKGESTVIYGENGTGKSTIADALEWFFRGEIELLSHEGRQHAVRYVGGDDDGTTSVEVVTSGDLGGKVVFPDERTPDTFEALRRETFLLRGRTLADFINKTKTEKWKALVEILGLDAIESLREDLQRARNDLRKASKAADEEVRVYRRALASGGDTVSEETVLSSLSQICELLGVDPPQSLDQVADPAWITSAVGASSSASSSARENLLAEIEAITSPDFNKTVFESWNKLVVSDRARLLPRASLVREAKRLFEAESIEAGRCPVCGQKVDQKVLARRIESSLVEMMEASRDLERVRDPILEQAEVLESAYEQRDAIHDHAVALGLDIPSVPVMPDPRVQDHVRALAPIDVNGITTYLSEVRRWDKAVAKVGKQISSPEPSERDNQLMMLAALCQQIRAWQQAETKSARAKRAVIIAENVFDKYQQKQKDDLGELLERISGRVAKFYSTLHPGEDLDSVSIEPWTAKGIELAIDFYGSRQRPPHGVLSESHLNSLAIAVFLAMAASFNEKLGFLILDDVINSFDVEHRGRLAELLADGFSEWQLIVLTHDQQFFEHLSRRAPSWRKIEFTSWSHASGPRTTKYETSGMLAAARERLQSDDVHGAATKARRALEELLQEVCEALWAPLPFRRGQANDRREIGELFIGLRRSLKEHAKSQLQSIEPIFKHLEADVGATLNVAAHASRGRSGASEVRAALERIETLDALWSCPDCKTRVWHKGTPDSARCRCGKSAFPPVVVA